MQRRQRQHSSSSGRDESGASFSPTSSLSSSPFASSSNLQDSFSDSESTTSTTSFSSSTSPSSSLASSPALNPTKSFSPIPDDFHLVDSKPSPSQVTNYAISVIRAEAYALLALAARMTPADEPIVDDDLVSADYAIQSGVQHKQKEATRTGKAFLRTVKALCELPKHGKIIVCGVGKSGIAGRKIVGTLNSLGIQAIFLHPVEAMHGDLGVVCPCNPTDLCDAVLLVSHSGATQELMRILPILRPRVRTMVAVTRDPDSILAKGCAQWLDAGTGAYMGGMKDGEKVTDEADSALPAPTSSVMTALAICDALALSLSKMRLGWGASGKERRANFLYCHPGGQLSIELGREGRGVAESVTPMPTPAVTPVA
ncbi:hypothetical protein P7C70_g4785, partial [Phenoliferia sp. Uapishka_3]